MGTFALDAEGFKKTLIVAGGIGITPIRALLRAYKDHPVEGHAITVLYSDDRGEFCYKDFWKDLETVPGVEVRLISDREIFMKDTDTYAKDVQNDAEYLIAGSPGMNNAFTERLEALASRRKISRPTSLLVTKKKSVLPSGGTFSWAGHVLPPLFF